MSKTNAEALLRKAQRQVANTSGGGHLGGTNFGQGNDAKTSSGSGNRPGGQGPPASWRQTLTITPRVFPI